MEHKRGLRMLVTMAMLAVGLACTVSVGGSDDSEAENLKLQLTVQALQMTQAVSANNQQPVQPPPAPQSESNTKSQGNDTENSKSANVESKDGIPCNSSNYVSETIKDGTVFIPGENFTKSWTLRNAGDCDWNEDYVFEFEEGTRMGGESAIKVNTVIEPNETVTFQVNLKAPDKPGDYTGVWRLKSDDGEKLGKYWVKIKVGGPAQDFAVTGVTYSTAANPIDLVCPANVNVKANITANGPGTVTYKWEDCEGATSTGSVTFDSAGTKTVSHNVFISWSDTHWARIYIDVPNHQWFAYKDFIVVCNP